MEVRKMSIIDGCIGKYKTPVAETRVCPICGKTVEVFTSMGAILEDAVCTCGYVWEGQPHPALKTD